MTSDGSDGRCFAIERTKQKIATNVQRMLILPDGILGQSTFRCLTQLSSPAAEAHRRADTSTGTELAHKLPPARRYATLRTAAIEMGETGLASRFAEFTMQITIATATR